jgi:hypothetical protein
MGFYTPAQVARRLGAGISSHRVRRLCETGWLAAELTDGNRWLISESEAERLREYVRRDGDLPPIPRPGGPAPPDRRINTDRGRRGVDREDDHEDDREEKAPESAVSPEVQAETDSLAIAERRLIADRLLWHDHSWIRKSREARQLGHRMGSLCGVLS